MTTIRATVLQAGLAQDPAGTERLKIATDRDGTDNAFWLDADADCPPTGCTVSVDGDYVVWTRADGSMASARRRGFWFDDRGKEWK